MQDGNDVTLGTSVRPESDASISTQGIASWYVTGVLMVAYACAFLDRQILSLLVEPIKSDLHLNDTEVSLLQGIAFAGLLALVGLPIGRLVDTRRRTPIIALGIAFWSLMTASCGIARSYGQLFLSRMGVGVGEACLTPSAYSLIADCFPPKRHGLVFGIYGVGVYAGLGLSYIIGGEVIRRVGSGTELVLPWIGAIRTWRLVFMAVGLPGLLVAGWVATLREPARPGSGLETLARLPLAGVLSYFRAHWRPILLANLCIAFAAMTAYSLSAWVPTFFIRTYGWTAPQIGSRFGLIVALSGAVGYVLGGWAGDALVSRGATAGRLNIIVVAALTAVAPTVAAPLMDDPWRALELYCVAIFLVTMAVGLGPVVQLTLVPAGMRGMAISLGVLVVNVLGLGLGPTAVALVTDYVVGDEGKIRYALAAMPAAMLLLCAACGFFCRAPLIRRVRELEVVR